LETLLFKCFVLLPIRLAHAERYIETKSLRTDMTILLKTLFR